jgi:hypothetical protein
VSKTQFLSPVLAALVAVFLGYIVAEVLGDVLSENYRFYILTLLLLNYLYHEIKRLTLYSNDRWLLNPAVLCSIVTFIVPFGIGNVIYLLPDEHTTQVGLSSLLSPVMPKAMFITLLAAAAMWTGYWSRFAANLGQMLLRVPLVKRVNSGQFAPRLYAVIISLLFILAIRLSMINLGIYGFSTDGDSLVAASSFRQYLVSLELLSRFILIVISLQFFSLSSPDRFTKRLLLAIVFIEIFFGFLSGFKSAVSMPVITVGVSYYYCTNKLNFKFILLAIILLLLAYAIIEPFRNARANDRSFSSTSLRSIANTIISTATESLASGSSKSASETTGFSVPLAVLARSSMAYVASLGIEYKDSGRRSENAPQFLADIFLSPLYAFVPRALWANKEMARHGQWYVQEVMGFADNTTTAVGMSPFTYLYFAGGWCAVCLGFLFVGVVHRVFELTLMRHGGVIYIMMLSNIVSVDSVFYSIILESLRSIFILTLFFIFIYKRVESMPEKMHHTDKVQLDY